MCAKVATPKQTGGGGFNYEDKVGAYFLLCMLLNQHPFSIEVGLIDRIDLQKSAAGWAFDDYLITLSNNGQLRRVGVSVKSNQQFSENVIYGAPLKNLWEQNLELNGRTFNKNSDYCCIAQPPLRGDVANNLNTLINLAIHQHPEDLDNNINTLGYGSKEKLELYKSFACPDELGKQFTGKKLLPGQVLSRFLFLPFDFEEVVSKSENEFIRMASALLVSSSLEHASRLYEKLQQVCKNLRPVGGYVNLSSLVNLLKHEFELKQFPSFSGDLDKIANVTKLWLSNVKTTIGNSFSIDRSIELKGIEGSFSTGNICCVTSPSGFGKTTLAKLYVITRQEKDTVLWLNASHFETDIRSKLELQHPLEHIIAANTKGRMLIVIDGLERFYTDGQVQYLAMFLNSILTAKDTFKILFTCVAEDLDGVLQNLYGYGITKLGFSQQIIENKDIDFISLAAHFPNMLDLLRSTELRLFLSNIKILDALSFTLTKRRAEEFAKRQLTESEIIDFLWKKQVETGGKGMLLGNVAKSIAQTQGNTLRMGVSNSVIDAAHAAGLTALVRFGIIYEQEDYFYFHHDIYGDWARYKVIRSHTHEIKSFLLTLDIGSPLWAKAIRQYGIYLLELKSKEDGWLNLYLQFDETSAHEKIIKNILLESIIFCTNALDNLNTLSEPLLANKAELLSRLLRVFLNKATSANPSVLNIAKTIKRYSATEATVLHRIPTYEYWPPVLEFIYTNREQLVKDDYPHCARITSDWLIFTQTGSVCRKKMAELAISLSAIAVSNRAYFYGENKQYKERAFEGLLNGYSEAPETSHKLILKLSERMAHREEKKENSSEATYGRSFRFREAKKWPHGPFRHVDDVFADVCLNGRSLEVLFGDNPTLANEVLLATLIKAPQNDYYYDEPEDNDLDLNVPRGWYPPFYRRGPFLNLLHINHLAALDGIIKLVDFVTGQWRRKFEKDAQIPCIELNINGLSKKFYGDFSTYFWYRNIGTPPHSIVSVLMAVERFLYEVNEQLEIQLACIKYLLAKSDSLAFVGLLVSTGKAFPELFKDVLLPCLEIQDFYIWEKHNIDSFHLELYSVMGLPVSQREEANNWNKEHHRSTPLDDLMLDHMLNSPAFEPIYQKITQKWEERLSKIRYKKGFDIYSDRMLSFFQKENYVLKPFKEGMQYYEYVEPAELTARMIQIREELDASQIHPSAFTVYQFLEKKQQPSLEELESLWELIEKLKTRKVKNFFNHLETPLSSILGSYIIFLKYKDVWFNAHPEYYNIIFDYTDSIFTRISEEKITVTNYSVQYAWNTFAPQLVAYCWKESDSEQIRGWITLICSNLHVESVGLLFLSCSRIFGWHHPQFINLQNYVLAFSAITRPVYSPNPTINTSELVAIHRKFIDNQIPSNPEKWENHRVRADRKSQKRSILEPDGNDDQLLAPGLNLSLLHAAYKHLPGQDLPDVAEERAQIVFLWKEAMGQVVYQFGDLDKVTHEVDEFPSDFDRWVIGTIPSLLGEPMNDNFFEDFAEPLLKFGYFTPEWNEIFCSSILLNNLDKRDRYDIIFPRWKQIVHFCLTNENWKYQRNRREKYLLCSLFLFNTEYSVWDYDYSTFTTKASDAFIDFFNRKSFVPPVVKALCKFAKTVSGKHFLKQALHILHVAITDFVAKKNEPIPEGAVRKPFYAIDTMGSLLSTSWENNHVQIRADRDMFNSYKALVVFLVSEHNPVGIELQGLLLAR